MKLPPSAPVTRYIDAKMVREISALLDRHRVPHGPLLEGSPNLNVNLSDEECVFVKVTRPGSGPQRLQNELVSSVWARDHGVSAPEPLISQVCHLVDTEGRERHAIVLRWMDVGHRPDLRTQTFDALDVLAQLREVEVPPWAAQYDLDMYIERVRRRLAGRVDCVALEVLAEAEKTYTRIAAALPGRQIRWSHCDLHLGNLGWGSDGRPVVLDWESASMAAVETDVAQVLRSIEVNETSVPAARRRQIIGEVGRAAAQRFDLDWQLVVDTIRFRTASASSQLLVSGDRPGLLLANVELLRRDDDWRPVTAQHMPIIWP